MTIWFIDHYSVPEKYYPLIRQTNFAKQLIKLGHKVKIIGASSVHNSSVNLIKGKELFRNDYVDDVDYTYIKCRSYQGNGVSRILNMLEFSRKLPKVCYELLKKEGKPDVIIACSMTLQACKKSIEFSRKHEIKVIAQITDLWPESIVEYKGFSKKNPIIIYLRKTEKWIYKNADRVIFTLEGAYDYIEEQHWQKEIPKEKVKYINNGVDLLGFRNNKDTYRIEDDDLDSEKIFKVIYTGSIRKVNNIGLLLDVAKRINNESIKILIWGTGDELDSLKKRVLSENIQNLVFKGKVEKKYIPYITSKADLNIAHNNPSKLFRFGISFNKLFDYFAAGKPILSDFYCPYNPAVQTGAGVSVDNPTADAVAREIEKMAELKESEYLEYCKNSVAASEVYDFTNLTRKLLDVINEIKEME